MFKPGDVVEVRPPEEILATLDGQGSLDAMPFMPEMARFVGQRFTVAHRVEKICDTVTGSGPPRPRRMRDTVFLEDLRCDGSAHGGCQAACRLYWKEAWLRPVEADSEPAAVDGGKRGELEAATQPHTTVTREVDGAPKEAFRCQATEAFRATEPLSNYDISQYKRELSSGNVSSLRMLRVGVRSVLGMIGRRLRILGYVPLRRPIAKYLPERKSKPEVETRPNYNLQPGDWVKVRDVSEIEPTLNDQAKLRGLNFDWEMKPFCGRRFQVKDRVSKIIDERNGEMIEIKSDCIMLEGAVCSGDHSRGRWFCPRQIYPYWREAWLEPVKPPADRGAR